MNSTNSIGENTPGPAPLPAPGAQSTVPRKLKKRIAISAVIVLPVAVLACLSSPKFASDNPVNLFLEALGWVFFSLYSFIRFWSTMYIGSRKSRELQTDGPYSICRNPLYLGSFCLAFGIVVFFTSLTLLAAVLVVGLIYIFNVIPREEYVLQMHFGKQFESYAAKTPRLFPRLGLYRTGEAVNVSLKGMHREAKYQLLSLLLMLAVSTISHLRHQPWWPHYFNLP